jgi:hypothetical protein
MRGLAGVVALGLFTGCRSGHSDDSGPPGPGKAPDPDLALLAAVIAEKSDLLGAYEAATTRFPPLNSRLKPLRADHAAHLAALTGFRPGIPTAAPSGSASPSAGPQGGQSSTVEDLAAAELAAAGRRIGQCRTAADPQLARLLASIGGCEAAHAAVLRSGTS